MVIKIILEVFSNLTDLMILCYHSGTTVTQWECSADTALWYHTCRVLFNLREGFLFVCFLKETFELKVLYHNKAEKQTLQKGR